MQNLTKLTMVIILQYTYTHMKTLCCKPKTNNMLYVNYISIKLEKFLKALHFPLLYEVSIFKDLLSYLSC